ncbi:glycoside hydrolase family 2 protein [Dothidotthia symphoricarpi CBS 119687]|uniref:Glycoside hydrolase family 2 protein n=1 Tax=Dothidotthia symphoricarpi CBS 119687 TaxID=1392245 RepID=A0A6A6AT37_9PLEO|nr:glycoside hydrolase family 2 protein [Dothidotthia symphoricarpi CBS 119687]KAF2133711.1 glycoside hydrolase family 2 protein [Dothidotthia symphoricarpi CBS 119687]
MRLSSGFLSLFLVCPIFATNIDGIRPRQSNETEYKLGKITLDTPWTASVGTNPWPEHPRPRLQRALWKNLNGVWRFRNATKGDDSAPPFGQTLERAVLIPSCLESALSGITELRHTYSWFQTSFDIPSDWQRDNRVVLNFGAVDYQASVFVNGQQAGTHTGGYFEFSFDVTNYLSANGTNELLVHVYDPTDMDRVQIPIGKQTLGRDGNSIWYTPCTGIWQTVWLESTPSEYVSKLDLNAEMDGTVNMTVHSSTNSTNTPFQISFLEPDSDEVKFTTVGISGKPFIFKVDAPELWTPDTPTLYNISISFGGDASDEIQSYTGFRTISRGEIDGVQRPLLNGEFVFPFGPLDQGFWPDGIYTPPSVEAMVFDLQQLKEVGINMVRKHIKVEPALYYRACDEMGLLIIQDMPSLRPDLPATSGCGTIRLEGDAEQKEFNRQLGVLVEQLKNYPSIFAWTIYNEEWGQSTVAPWPEFGLTDMVRSLDPTRLVNAVSGWTDHTAGDFDDNHHYSTPQCGTPFWSTQGSGYDSAYDPSRIGLQGEFGGIGQYVAPANSWFKSPSQQSAYELTNTTAIWNYRCIDLLRQLREQVELFACSGGVWTQTTDVEGEVNGLMTYDRRVNRMDRGLWREGVGALRDAARGRAGNGTLGVATGVEVVGLDVRGQGVLP